MHMLGTPRTMQSDPHYEYCLEEIALFFRERLAFAASQGIEPSRVILDPGIGFGKRLSDNLDILANLMTFKRQGFPVLVGASRQRFIAMVHPSGRPPEKRLGGSIAAAVAGMVLRWLPEGMQGMTPFAALVRVTVAGVTLLTGFAMIGFVQGLRALFGRVWVRRATQGSGV